MFGSGCWAERSAGGRSVACSVSGQGELIVQSLLAKSLAERAAASTEGDTHEILRSVLVDQFYGASLLSSKCRAYKMHLPTRPSLLASECRKVEPTRRAPTGGRRASPHPRRGWGRRHWSVATSIFTTELSTHTPQLDSGAHSPHKAWPSRTRRPVTLNQKLDPLPRHRRYNSLLIGGNQAQVLRNTAHDFSNDDGRPPLFITTLPC